MRRARAAATLLLALSSAAQADLGAELGRCRALADDAARLSCYDRIGTTSVTVPVPAPAAPAAGAAMPPAPPAPQADAAFGAETLPQRSAPRQEEPALHAHIRGDFTEWRPGTRIELDNGQVWTVINDERGYYPNIPANPEVVVEHAMFGGYRMTIVALHRSIRVRRVK